MHEAITSKQRARALSAALFLIALAVLAFTGNWWPGIMLGVGLPLALRQYLLGRTYDMCLSLLVFVGTFITVQFDITWRIFLPILFTLGAIYILFREFSEAASEKEAEKEDDLNHELEEKK
jgi:ABC-type multidrug transport system fused ATPase/permease subunit